MKFKYFKLPCSLGNVITVFTSLPIICKFSKPSNREKSNVGSARLLIFTFVNVLVIGKIKSVRFLSHLNSIEIKLTF